VTMRVEEKIINVISQELTLQEQQLLLALDIQLPRLEQFKNSMS
jgi:hypothetical protein